MAESSVTAAGYAKWRATPLGATTERIEREVVLELAGPLAGRRVLDVGCGDGTYAIAAALRGADVTGVDARAEMLSAARRRATDSGATVRLEQADASSLPYEDDSFDVVIAVTVLCFVADPSRAVREMARVLRPGGRLVLGELNRWSTWAAWRRLRGWLGSATWRAARSFDRRQLHRLVAAAGLRAERAAGAIYYPPLAAVAVAAARLDPLPRAVTTLGAAFVAVAARRPER